MPIPVPPPAPASATAAPASTALDRRLAAGQKLLEAPDTGRYTVQLLVSDPRSRAYLESYLGEAGRAVDPEALYVVPGGSPESSRYAVLFGAYPSKAQAAAALEALAEPLRQFKPYVRSLDSIREEARRAERR